ncbi:MAG: restriction endonuclease subunit S [Porphyromonas sp.]
MAKLERGTTITKKVSTEGDYPVISGGQKPAYYIDTFNRQGETITVAGSGAYAGFVMYWNEPIFVSDAFSIKANENQILPRYVYLFLKSIQSKIYKFKAGGGVPHVYAKDVSRISIPVPPMSVQEKIVNILDKFDTLTNSITEGLPKEIELRRKQYEYYREQLLSF